MTVSMQCQVLNTFCLRKNTNKKQSHQKHKQKTQLSFPRSLSPSQLVVHQKPSPQSKLEALCNVVDELETSVKRGVTIDDPKIFASLLETCFGLEAIEQGIRIHR